MALSRDNLKFSFPLQVCFHNLLALLPFMYVHIEPFTSAQIQVESQSLQSGTISTKAQILNSTETIYYRYKFKFSPVDENSCKILTEASTSGITDLGLGQLTLRQILITLDLTLKGKIPPGSLPLFLLKDAPVPTTSSQFIFQEKVNKAFQLSKRGMPDEALKYFQEALTLFPNSSQVHFHVGVLLMILGYLPEAAAAFEQVTKNEPANLLARPYLEDVKIRINKKATVSSGKQAPAQILGYQTPGSGNPPGNVAHYIDVEKVETQKIKVTFEGKLIINKADNQFVEYTINKPKIIIGRHEDSDVVLTDSKVSRRHFQIICLKDVCLLTDLGSVNGTFFNGQRLKPFEDQPLNYGDVIKLGDVEIVYSK